MTLLDLTPRVTEDSRLFTLPVAIIGGGPIGLAAAANLAERGIDFLVFEAGGDVAASVRSWGHTRLFSPWKHLVDPASRRLLEERGWQLPDPERAPTGAELVEKYVVPLAALDELASRIRLGVEVIGVSREGMDRTRTARRAATPFAVRIRTADDEVQDIAARAVIDASGTYLSPNSLSSNGLELLGMGDITDRVTPALPDVLGRDRAMFAGRRITVVGAGHSAANTLLALVKLAREEAGTTVTWMIRNAKAVRVSSSPDDQLVGRADLGSRVDRAVDRGDIALIDGFEIIRARRGGEAVELVGHRRGEVVTHDTDIVVNATGFRPNLEMLREIRLDLDEIVEAPKRLAPLIDPNVHSCGTVEPHGFRELTHPEQGFFIVGMKSYGRAPTFLLATGYEQVRSVTAWLAGDTASASQVDLVIPATGVCSTDAGNGGGCCS
ncbi:NAD(P)-binding domain-containing protein [Microbacterium sp. zg.Y1090]|uniref:NAD(P)-binding domain-containing protein n=1 Tax=Microbacterium TaxID=33882 RepID=UPI00214BF0BE|nr:MULTISPECIES: NAD(P)-binding domain-containing protein [unclassified Microbacterium]MCR2811744.1 NAD(P)-binding domain-containing protein [Microbacterium sp. zg.Y1084]MCR2818818.1 NAD(P)-binding domain-containing protein [Microbacterium sp. zg.Y1090]MDL5486909.1 NAD(P)-binding domain-containing protein [Microbacterium sp. zg-Y1211]WIM27132.1 NAD(P)-binding domain-containing protein [Microbacterium sp. zg-Y1090]